METQSNLTLDQRFMSEHIDQLATALSKAQSEIGVAIKNQKNPFFKSSYADFESIVAVSRPSLTKYGISIIQPPFIFREDGAVYLITLMMHNSGQWIKSQALYNPIKSDIQSLSSYNTYLKRMCYTNMVGVVTSDYDDDGNAASISPKITQDQVNYLISLPEATQQRICQFNNVNNLDELTVEQYDKVVSMIKNRASK